VNVNVIYALRACDNEDCSVVIAGKMLIHVANLFLEVRAVNWPKRTGV
jgi:hypothetical protein